MTRSFFVVALKVDDANRGTVKMWDEVRQPRVQNKDVAFASFFGDGFLGFAHIFVHRFVIAVAKGCFEVGFGSLSIAKGWYTNGKNTLQIVKDGRVNCLCKRSQSVAGIAMAIRVNPTKPADHGGCIKVKMEETSCRHLGQLRHEILVREALVSVVAEREKIDVGVVAEHLVEVCGRFVDGF